MPLTDRRPDEPEPLVVLVVGAQIIIVGILLPERRH